MSNQFPSPQQQMFYSQHQPQRPPQINPHQPQLQPQHIPNIPFNMRMPQGQSQQFNEKMWPRGWNQAPPFFAAQPPPQPKQQLHSPFISGNVGLQFPNSPLEKTYFSTAQQHQKYNQPLQKEQQQLQQQEHNMMFTKQYPQCPPIPGCTIPSLQQWGPPGATTYGMYGGEGGKFIDQPQPPAHPPPPSEPERPPEPPSPASDLLRNPGRSKRPEKIVFVMRGLPGSGKSYCAQLVRAIELEHSAPPPRILSIDDYFLTEVEMEEPDPETGKTKKVKKMEYEYDEALLQSYRSSLQKAFSRTIAEGQFHFVIIDDVNLRVVDFSDYRRLALFHGFSFYLVETDVSVEVCARQNTHGWTTEQIRDMSRRWESAPGDYDRLHTKGLERKQEDIQTVDMADEIKNGSDQSAETSRWDDDGDGDRDHEGLPDGKRKRSRYSPDTGSDKESLENDVKENGLRKPAKKSRHGSTESPASLGGATAVKKTSSVPSKASSPGSRSSAQSTPHLVPVSSAKVEPDRVATSHMPPVGVAL
eukprot:Ihof_evm12s7 gene=Ihof_evmTU12s7